MNLLSSFFNILSLGIIKKKKNPITQNYRGSKNSHFLGKWQAPLTTVNEEISNSWKIISSRMLQLVRDYPIFTGAVNTMETYFVSNGYDLVSTVKDKNGKLDKNICQEIQMLWNEYTEKDNFSFNGNLSFTNFLKLLVRQEAEFGESLFLKRFNDKNDDNPVQWEIIEPTMLDDGFYTDKRNIKSYHRGIEFYGDSLRPKFYYFKTIDKKFYYEIDETIKISAKYVHHNFKTLRANQVRGITPFASCLIYARFSDDYLQSELASQRISSRWLAFVKNNNPLLAKKEQAEYKSDFDRWTKSLDYLQIEYLGPNEEVQVNNVQRSSAPLIEIDNNLMKKIASAIELPYELLTSDYAGMNYALMRAKRNDFLKILESKWNNIIDNYCRPIFKFWLFMMASLDKFKTFSREDFFLNQNKFYSCQWRKPTLPAVDQFRDNRADIEKISLGLESHKNFIQKQGYDWETILEEQKEFFDKVENLGLSDYLTDKKTNQNTSPSKLEKENKNG